MTPAVLRSLVSLLVILLSPVFLLSNYSCSASVFQIQSWQWRHSEALAVCTSSRSTAWFWRVPTFWWIRATNDGEPLAKSWCIPSVMIIFRSRNKHRFFLPWFKWFRDVLVIFVDHCQTIFADHFWQLMGFPFSYRRPRSGLFWPFGTSLIFWRWVRRRVPAPF